MDHSPGCSALEEVAAFAEGRLRGVDRDRVVSHLSGCAECREVLAESIEVAEDLALEDGTGSVTPLRLPEPTSGRRFGSAWQRSTAAAAAVAVVASFLGWQAVARQRPPSRADWLAEMQPAQELLPHIWGGVVLRGEGEVGEDDKQSTEIGALLVDVDVALAAGDADRARDVLYRMATLVEDAVAMAPHDVTLRRIAEASDAAAMKAALAAELPGFETALRERFGRFYLDLGTFAEEAQVAERVGNREFLRSRAARRYLDWVVSQQEEPLPDAVREDLRMLRDTNAGSPARADAAERVLRAMTF